MESEARIVSHETANGHAIFISGLTGQVWALRSRTAFADCSGIEKNSHNASNTVARRWRFYVSSGVRTCGGLVQALAG
jgi:hypothetical protein